MGIVLTDDAAAEVQQVLDIQQEVPADGGIFVRVRIVGGGCSGLQYKLNLDSEFNPDQDVRYESFGIPVVTTKKFAPYLDGTVISLAGEPGDERRGFLVQNPHYAHIGCPGCGGH